MKTTRINTNGIQLTKMGLVNCYLVREPDGFTLVDAGLSGSEKAILQAARVEGAAIRRIVLTHAHVDHVGSVDALVASTKATLAASARTIPLLRQPPDMSLEPAEPQGKIRGGVPGIKTRVSQPLAEGDTVGSLKVIETPGHIPGHIALLDIRDGTLYAGDALIAVGHVSVSGFAPWYFPLPNIATWDKQLARKSAQKLDQFPIQRFACGHGQVRDGGMATLRQALAAAL